MMDFGEATEFVRFGGISAQSAPSHPSPAHPSTDLHAHIYAATLHAATWRATLPFPVRRRVL